MWALLPPPLRCPHSSASAFYEADFVQPWAPQPGCEAVFCGVPIGADVAPADAPGVCGRRCGCVWDTAQSACGCNVTAGSGLPPCQWHFPRPAAPWLDLLAQPLGNAVGPYDRVSMFGDINMWLGGYDALLRDALMAAGLQTVVVNNHGMKGADLETVVAGSDAHRQPGLAASLVIDMPTVVVLAIGLGELKRHHDLPSFQVK